MSLKDKAIAVTTIASMIFVTAFIATMAFCGVGLLIVKSGSMAPYMPPGSLLIYKPQEIEHVKVGQVIVFEGEKASNSLIAHRAVSRLVKEGELYIKTKGDNNQRADIAMVKKDKLVGTALCVVPEAGRVIAFTRTPIGMLILSLMLVFFVLLQIVEKARATEEKVCQVDVLADRSAYNLRTGKEIINPLSKEADGVGTYD